MAGSDHSTGSAVLTVTVTNLTPTVAINVPPPAQPTGFFEGDTITLTSTAGDAGGLGDISRYAWTVTGPDQFAATGAASSLSFTPTEVGTYTATLTVTDGDNAVTSKTQTVVVNHVQPVPVVEEASGTAADGSTISLSATVPDPGADDVFVYTVSLNGQAYIQPTTGGPVFPFKVPGPSGGNETITVTVAETAGDPDGGTGTGSTTIRVVPQNAPPVTLHNSDLAGASELLVLALGGDTVDASQITNTSATVTLAAVGSHNTLIGGPGVNIIQGDSGFNTLKGMQGPLGVTANNLLFGTG